MSIKAALGIFDTVLDRIIPDKNERARAKEALEAAEQSGDLDLLLGQLDINKQEAAHKSLFVAGWRPFIGWVCGLGLAYNVLLSPFLGIWLVVPTVDPSLLYPVMLGMLGLAGARSWEKSKGLARER